MSIAERISVSIIDQLEELGLPLITREFVATITPEIAAMMLAANTHNRKVIEAAQKQYAGAMSRGEWRYNGRTIVYSIEGVLLDGQHMLLACVESGVTIEALIVVGVDGDAQSTMDHNRKRTFQDSLVLDGEKYASTIAAVCRSVYAYETIGVPSTERLQLQPTEPQLYDVLERHPGIREIMPWASRKDSKPWFFIPSRAATLYYIFSTYNEEDTEVFFQKLASGKDLEDGDPILVLRERIIKDKGEPGKRLRMDAATAFTVKAFNAWRAGEKMKRLILKLGGASPEQFPQIEIVDGDKPHPLLPGRPAVASTRPRAPKP